MRLPLQAEAARAAYLQRKHESEVQAQLREQAYLSEANTREERYEAALAQHKLAEMKAIQERVSCHMYQYSVYFYFFQTVEKLWRDVKT